MTAVAIVGMACRYPDASTPEDLWTNVLAQRRAFRRIPAERLRATDYVSDDEGAADRTYCTEAAVLDGWSFDRDRFRIPGSTFRSTDLTHWLALEVAADALADAGHSEGRGLDGTRTGVIVGNTLTGEFSRAQLLRLRWPYVRRKVAAALDGAGHTSNEISALLGELEAAYKRPFPGVDGDTLAGALSNTIAGRICNAFDFKGGGYTVDGACASSLLAVATGCSALAAGDLRTAIVGGVDLSLDPFELVGFARAGALARREMRVYDRRSEGFWPGEGCGFLVLCRLEDALAGDVHVHAVIRGWGVSSDGRGGITRPEPAGQRLALDRAYERAGFGVETVALFEGHGTGTAVGDAVELESLLQARSQGDATGPAAIGSIKANIGHTKAAAGVAGLIKATMAVRETVIPPTTGCVEPHDLIRDGGATLRIVAEPEPWPASEPVRAGVNGLGFGGINSHVVLEAASARAAPRALPRPVVRLGASPQDAELFVFAAPDAPALSARLERVAAAAEALSRAEMGDLAAEFAAGARGPEAGRARAACVAGTREELWKQLELLRSLVDEGRANFVDCERGCALSTGRSSLRIGFVFPGQASPTYLDGGALARRFTYVRPLYAAAGLVGGDDFSDTTVAQPAIVTASLAGLAVLRRLGIRGSIAVGHSLGELTAFHWAGAIDRVALIRLASARGAAMGRLPRGDGAMAMVATSSEPVERLLAGCPDLCVAGLNGPTQTVVSGPAASVDRLRELAAQEHLATAVLPVSHAFHSPLVAPAADEVAAYLSDVGFAPLQRPVASTITGAILDASSDIGELVVTQITSPVRFAEALDAVVRTTDLLLEVGPGSVLTRLVRDSSEQPILALDAGGPSLRGILAAAGVAYAFGHPVLVEALFRDRFTRRIELDRPRQFLVNPCEAEDGVDVEVPEPLPSVADPPDLEEEPLESLDGDLLTVVRTLVARRAELSEAAIAEEDTLLGDLHLSSIQVAELASEAARLLGLEPPLAPAEIAGATVGQFAEFIGQLEPAQEHGDGDAPGVAEWVRAFRVDWSKAPPLHSVAPACRWATVVPPDYPLAPRVAAAFRDGEASDGRGVALFLPPDPSERHVQALLEAARAASDEGVTRFALIQHGGGAASFAKTLHLERPSLHVCVVDLPPGSAALDVARKEAEAASGFCEVAYDEDGCRRLPALRLHEVEPASDPPLLPDDVLLVTGGGKGIGAECALSLAQGTGARIALIGRARPDGDEALAKNLRRFRLAGVVHAYTIADVTDPRALETAVDRLQRELGPVTAVLHAAGSNVPSLLADLDEEKVRAALAPKLAGLRVLMDVLDESRLRLLVAFSSVIGRIGLRGEAHYALANEWLSRDVERIAERLPTCRCLSLEWSVWSGLGMGERLGVLDGLARVGVTPVSIDDGLATLERLLRARKLPTTVVVSGRLGRPPTVRFDPGELPLLRFVDRVRVHVPHVELVAETELSIGHDPYLADHELDHSLLMPGVISLEASAQVAAAFAGGVTIGAIRSVEFDRPITVPPDGFRTLRIAALANEASSEIEVVIRSDETGFQADHVRSVYELGPRAEETISLPVSDPRALADATVLYDAVLFQRGRFQRVLGYQTLHARSCVAEVESRRDGWFQAYRPQDLVLGDPGCRDAFLHAIQACVPHLRLLPVAVERIELGRPPDGVLRVRARERSHDGDTFVYDFEVVDASGALCERWRGLTLKSVRAVDAPSTWPPGLLVPYLERRVAELLGESAISVSLEERSARRTPAEHRPDGKPLSRSALDTSLAHLNGKTLAVAGPPRVGCDIEAVTNRTPERWRDLLGVERFRLARLLAADGLQLDDAATRVWTALECRRKAGQLAGSLTLAGSADDGWTVLRSGHGRIATYVTRMEGYDGAVAFGFLCAGDRS